MIKYLGSKRPLLSLLVKTVQQFGTNVTSVIDLFSGTSRVGHALKAAGYQVFSNDINAYAHTLALCYVQSDKEQLESDAIKLIAEMNQIKGEPGYFTETFCEKARFFKPKNGARIDAIREEIARKCLPQELEAVLLVSLMEAADRVDSTTGVQMAYLKNWATRADKDIELRLPVLLPQAPAGKSLAHRMDARDAVNTLEADLAYLDPPYNQHSYLGNYHVWESLITWDKPEVYGVACKRIDVKQRQSIFNSKKNFKNALVEVIQNIRAKHLIVSFNNEGFVGQEELEQMLLTKGQVSILENDYKRYVGAQIGIFNPKGEKVGKVSHLRNKEFLYVVTP